MKSKSSAKKRFAVGGTGRVKFKRATKQHLLSHRSSDNKRPLRKTKTISETKMGHMRKMLPGYF